MTTPLRIAYHERRYSGIPGPCEAPPLCAVCGRPLRAGSLLDHYHPYMQNRSMHLGCAVRLHRAWRAAAGISVAPHDAAAYQRDEAGITPGRS